MNADVFWTGRRRCEDRGLCSGDWCVPLHTGDRGLRLRRSDDLRGLRLYRSDRGLHLYLDVCDRFSADPSHTSCLELCGLQVLEKTVERTGLALLAF